MTHVGLTGGIASGKSTVCHYLEAKGCTIIDADVVAHELLLQGQPGYDPVVQSFGKGILEENGEIDRKRLGTLVFGNRALLQKLNELVHPHVIQNIQTKLNTFERLAVRRVIVDASLMIESGFHRTFQRLILVTCTVEQQVARLMRRANLSEAQARQRIALQMPLAEKRRFATDIIDNSGQLEQTRQQVDTLVENLEDTVWTM